MLISTDWVTYPENTSYSSPLPPPPPSHRDRNGCENCSASISAAAATATATATSAAVAGGASRATGTGATQQATGLCNRCRFLATNHHSINEAFKDNKQRRSLSQSSNQSEEDIRRKVMMHRIVYEADNLLRPLNESDKLKLTKTGPRPGEVFVCEVRENNMFSKVIPELAEEESEFERLQQQQRRQQQQQQPEPDERQHQYQQIQYSSSNFTTTQPLVLHLQRPRNRRENGGSIPKRQRLTHPPQQRR